MPRTLLLFDPSTHPASWNERMAPGDYAVHSSLQDPTAAPDAAPNTAPACTVFPSLPEAEAYARYFLTLQPTARCRIYDHQGFIGAPLRELRGPAHKPEGELSRRFRLWTGSILFFGGTLLFLYDWLHDFALSWPALLGARMVIPGLILLVTEAALLLYARRKYARRRLAKIQQ